ncbi:hypothetical protein BOVATA_046420 [Babesia ovata]|uniref:Uncharacterized protein n=1 Tax=Babesia ovata TaxID=189622 RepID=A0A2H6KJJ9_9APIC|nr:uncharacterized protein BOVATA_046420 [Babesia ovata]GBE63149.1 hypothetical protein BOVATA_046420 [Babesia ovata]
MREYFAYTKTNGDQNDSLKARIDAITARLKTYFNDGQIKPTGNKFNLSNTVHFGKYSENKSQASNGIKSVISKIEDLQEVYPKVSKLETELGQALAPSDPGLSSTLGPDVTVTDSVAARVKAGVDAVDFTNPLEPLLTEAAGKGIELLNEEVNRIISSHVDNIGPTIGEQIDRLQKPKGAGQSNNVQHFIDELQEKIDKLKPLVSGIDKSAEGYMKDEVGSLKDKVADLKRRIEEIDKAIKEFDEALRGAITDATLAVNTAPDFD